MIEFLPYISVYVFMIWGSHFLYKNGEGAIWGILFAFLVALMPSVGAGLLVLSIIGFDLRDIPFFPFDF
jgi:hypothetical protein